MTRKKEGRVAFEPKLSLAHPFQGSLFIIIYVFNAKRKKEAYVY
jgi:hypothetical protein